MTPSIQPDQVLKAIFDSTEPTGRDYYLGKFPASDPVTMQYQSTIREARHFEQVFNTFRIGPVSSRGALGIELGRVADTAISAAPNIHNEHKEKLNDGIRGILQAAQRDTIEPVRGIYDYEARYNVQGMWTKDGIKHRQEQIQHEIDNPPHSFTGLFNVSWAVIAAGVGLGAAAREIFGPSLTLVSSACASRPPKASS